MESDEKSRAAIVEGIFYPSDPEELKDQVSQLLEAAKSEHGKHESAAASAHSAASSRTAEASSPVDSGSAIIVPHAAYEHVGEFIAAAFASLLEAKDLDAAVRPYSTVMLLGTVHRDFSNQIFIPQYTSFDSPAGKTEIDSDLVEQLQQNSKYFHLENMPFEEEHSLETVLPFLSQLLPQAKIVPILLGQNSRNLSRELARAFSRIFPAQETAPLFVISSNLSGFTDSANASEQAKLCSDLLTSGNAQDLAEAIEAGKISACGGGGIQAVLDYFGEGFRFEALKKGRSGKIPPEQRELWYAAFRGSYNAARRRR